MRKFDRKFDFDPGKNPNYTKEYDKLIKKIEEEEIIYHITKLKTNKKVCEYNIDAADNLHTIIIKECKHEIKGILSICFNFWKESGDVTDNINMRILSPMIKDGKSQETVKGLRPLSIEKVVWKLYQMIITQRINEYVANLGILSKYQYAGKKGSGSEDCLIDFSQSVYQQLLYNPVHAISIDSSDAYDSQDLLIINDKFRYHAGFKDDGLIMVHSLLNGRKSICRVNNVLSEEIDTISGPYQGEPPAAIIWCVYVNPLV